MLNPYFNKKIPKLIHLVFLKKDDQLNNTFSKCLNLIKSVHPRWVVKVYNEDDAQDIFLKYIPELFVIYNSYSLNIQKADFFRVVLIYLFGGFYMDLDMLCLKPLDELLEYNLILAEERSIKKTQKTTLARFDKIEVKHTFRLANYMFGGTPKHPFWLFFFKEAIRVSQRKINHTGDIFETTGPALLTTVYHRYRKQFPEITVLRNCDRSCITPFHNEISCHFGNFASHLHKGTWRWKNSEVPIENHKYIENKRLSQIEKEFYLRIKSVEKSKVYIEQPNIFIKRNLLGKILYNQLRASVLPLSRSIKKVQKSIIIVGIDTFVNIGFTENNNYILVIIENIVTITSKTIEQINRHVSTCIVFNEFTKTLLTTSKIETNIHILDQFYLPVKRNLSTDFLVMKDFNIGFYCSRTIEFEDLAIALDFLQKPNKSFHLTIFHNGNVQLPKINGVRYVNIKNFDLTSRELNKLSIYINLGSDNENNALLKSALYSGIPSISNYNFDNSKKSLLKYLYLIEDSSQKAIANALLTVEKEYRKYNRKSLSASRYIEDQYSIEKVVYDIIKLCQSTPKK